MSESWPSPPAGLLLLASILPLSVDEDPNTSAPTITANVPLRSPLVPAESVQNDRVPQNPAESRSLFSPSSGHCSVDARRENPQQQQQQNLSQRLLVPY